MKPARFTYHAPRSLDAALDLLAEHGDDAKVLAGGQSLLPMLNFRLAQIEHLVDINRLPGLDRPRVSADTVTLPALVRQRHVENSAELADTVPLLGKAIRHVAHPQIRNRGTVCGSLAHADPAAELPCVFSVLDAEFRLMSRRGTRTVRAEDFFRFHFTTATEPDELLAEVVVRREPGALTGFREFAARRGDFALSAAAVNLRTDDTGTVTACRIAVAGVAAIPLRLPDVEAAAVGQPVTAELLADLDARTRAAVDPPSDIHASANYRRRLVGALVRRAVSDAAPQREVSHA